MSPRGKSRRAIRRGWIGVLRQVAADFRQDQVALVAGGVAFYWLLALFPTLAATVTLGALVAEPDAILRTVRTYSDLLPPEVLDLIARRVSDLAAGQREALTTNAALWFGASLWVSLAGVRGIMSGVNIAWDLEETRGWLASSVIAVALMAFGLGVMILAALFFAALPLVHELTGLGELEQALWLVRWPLLASAMIVYLSLMYRWAPCRRAEGRAWITPGAALATALFLVASAGFSAYVQQVAVYSDTYGSLSNGVVLLLWFWLSAIAVLIGAELDSELERVELRRPR